MAPTVTHVHPGLIRCRSDSFQITLFERARIERSGPFQFPGHLPQKRSLTIGKPAGSAEDPGNPRALANAAACQTLTSGMSARAGTRDLYHCPSSPTGRGSGLRHRPVLVRIQGGVPVYRVAARVAQPAEAAGRDPVQCWFESNREHHSRVLRRLRRSAIQRTDDVSSKL